MNHLNNTHTHKIDANITPSSVMNMLSPSEVKDLIDTDQDSELYQTFRRCALAVLNTGSMIDDTNEVLSYFHDFEIQVIQQSRGIKISLKNAPSSAFVDGKLITGINKHLFSVLRDTIYIHQNANHAKRFDNNQGINITDSVFKILRHANMMLSGSDDPLVICWGGHSISRQEYDYTKEVGYQLGLRGLNIGTGCGPGAMKGPMKGATIGHAKQHIKHGRYIGLTEPDIIAAEPPNPIVNELAILPDIEKRLEAFVRMAHGIIVFPGGVGTAEEIFYLIGILLQASNKDIPFPVIFTAPKESQSYFDKIDQFLVDTLGPNVRSKYEIIIADSASVAQHIKQKIKHVFDYRKTNKDAYYFNWLLHVPHEFQIPFDPTHENMLQLNLKQNQPPEMMAANLRRAFSGIVAGNVKKTGVQRIQSHGPYQLHGDPEIIEPLNDLLISFAEQGRMKLGGKKYQPCFKIIKESDCSPVTS